MSGGELPLALVVFAHDEEANVGEVLAEILRWLRARPGDFELVFVDDGSRDATRARALLVMAGDERCTVVAHPRRKGIGAALKSGVSASTLPWVSFLPCDGQVPVAGLDTLCDEAAREGVRVVFSVYRDRDDGARRKVLSFGVRALIRAVHGAWLRSDGPYLFRRELFDAGVLLPDSFFLNFEFPIRVMRAHEAHRVVTIECVPRRAGTSKSSGLGQVAIIARDLFKLRLRLWREAVGGFPER